jgi:hypothetical protein
MATNPVITFGNGGNSPDGGAVDFPTDVGGSRRRFGTLYVIDIADLINLDHAHYPDDQHTLNKSFDFAKGKITVKMYVDDMEIPSSPDPIILNDNVYIDVYASYVDSLQTLHETQLFSGNVVINNAFYCRADLARMYGIKLCFTTYYNDTLEQSEAVKVWLECYSPAIATAWDSIVTFMNVTQGAFLYSKAMDGVVLYDEFLSDQGLGYGIASSYRNAVLSHIGYYNCSDLVDFLTKFDSTISDIDIIPPEEPAPAGEDDPSAPGGGGGDYDPASDPIDFPSLPTGGAFASGAIKAFKVTSGTLTNIFLRLWDASLFDINTFQKLLESPIDAIISLLALPITPTVGNDEHIKLGGYDTTEYGKRITTQYLTIDCGAIAVKEFWGSALDYEPYTYIDLFLPFIGIKRLKTEDVMKKTIQVKYNIDILTGIIVANVKCGNSVLYKYNGNIKSTIPISSRVYDAMEQLIKGVANTAGSIAVGNAAGAVSSAISTAVNVALSKAQISRTGDLSGVAGVLDDFVPYLIIHRPVQSLAQNYKAYKGHTSNITAVLNSLSGYTEVEYIHLTNIDGATDAELDEIERLLKEGVII